MDLARNHKLLTLARGHFKAEQDAYRAEHGSLEGFDSEGTWTNSKLMAEDDLLVKGE